METMVSVGDNSRTMTEIVIAFIRNRGEVLLTRRGGDVDIAPGHWDGISARIDEGTSAVDAARRLVLSATGCRR